MQTISVVIPAYNAEKTILETIESAFQQTFTDFELVVIDDGSSDNTAELVNTIAYGCFLMRMVVHRLLAIGVSLTPQEPLLRF